MTVAHQMGGELDAERGLPSLLIVRVTQPSEQPEARERETARARGPPRRETRRRDRDRAVTTNPHFQRTAS